MNEEELKILCELEVFPLTKSELAEATGIEETKLGNLLQKLRKENAVELLKGKKWQISEFGRKLLEKKKEQKEKLEKFEVKLNDEQQKRLLILGELYRKDPSELLNTILDILRQFYDIGIVRKLEIDRLISFICDAMEIATECAKYNLEPLDVLVYVYEAKDKGIKPNKLKPCLEIYSTLNEIKADMQNIRKSISMLHQYGVEFAQIEAAREKEKAKLNELRDAVNTTEIRLSKLNQTCTSLEEKIRKLKQERKTLVKEMEEEALRRANARWLQNKEEREKEKKDLIEEINELKNEAKKLKYNLVLNPEWIIKFFQAISSKLEEMKNVEIKDVFSWEYRYIFYDQINRMECQIKERMLEEIEPTLEMIHKVIALIKEQVEQAKVASTQ